MRAVAAGPMVSCAGFPDDSRGSGSAPMLRRRAVRSVTGPLAPGAGRTLAAAVAVSAACFLASQLPRSLPSVVVSRQPSHSSSSGPATAYVVAPPWAAAARGSAPRWLHAARRIASGAYGRRSIVATAGGTQAYEKPMSRKEKKLLEKAQRKPLPPEVEHLISSNFIQRIRDSGPLDIAPEGIDLPEVDAAWIADNPEDTARNVVNALCVHRFGESVCVDQVIGGSDAARGREYKVTLSLTDRAILGSCVSSQVQQFDKCTESLLESLRELDGWTQPIYRLTVQTSGLDDLILPDDLWRCDHFPCEVTWQNSDGKTRTDFLKRWHNETESWSLAGCAENWGKTGHLTNQQKAMQFSIPSEAIQRARLHLDGRSQRLLRVAKQALRLRETHGLFSATRPPVADLMASEEGRAALAAAFAEADAQDAVDAGAAANTEEEDEEETEGGGEEETEEGDDEETEEWDEEETNEEDEQETEEGDEEEERALEADDVAE